MRFISPLWLLLLVPVAALAVGYVLQQRRRSRYAVRFATLPMLDRLVPERPGWRRHLPAVLLLSVFALLGLTAARPEVDTRVPRETATVLVTLDVSNSMGATDIDPSRIEAASDAAATFIRRTPERFNVGVVTFSGTTAVLSPPTTDHRLAAAVLEELALESSTAIGEGVFTSLRQVAAQARLYGEEDVPAHIVLLSDGRNTVGRTPARAAEAARAAGVPVSTILYGTENAGDGARNEVATAALQHLAETTGGTAYTAGSSDELDTVYEDIRSAIGWRTEPTEVTSYLTVVALLTGLAAAALSLRWFVRLP